MPAMLTVSGYAVWSRWVEGAFGLSEQSWRFLEAPTPDVYWAICCWMWDCIAGVVGVDTAEDSGTDHKCAWTHQRNRQRKIG
jgi:hypothetical protein